MQEKLKQLESLLKKDKKYVRMDVKKSLIIFYFKDFKYYIHFWEIEDGSYKQILSRHLQQQIVK